MSFERWSENVGSSLLLLIGIFIYEMNWPKWALIYVYGYLGNAKSWFLKSYHIVLLRAAKTVRPRLPNQPDLPALARLPSKGQSGRILKIMIFPCPSTHKHRFVFILSSSFRIWISPLEVTVHSLFFYTGTETCIVIKPILYSDIDLKDLIWQAIFRSKEFCQITNLSNSHFCKLNTSKAEGIEA